MPGEKPPGRWMELSVPLTPLPTPNPQDWSSVLLPRDSADLDTGDSLSLCRTTDSGQRSHGHSLEAAKCAHS